MTASSKSNETHDRQQQSVFRNLDHALSAPPFNRIVPEHFRPAYDRALAEHAAEIDAIASNAEPATFENTIIALEDSGQLLRKVEAVFGNLAASHTNDALQEIERDLAPILARHWNEIFLNTKLFGRIERSDA